MKALNVKQLDEKSEEIADTLISLGMSRNVARTLAYLQGVDKATSIELEKVARLHQPEVSVAMKTLKERDWINMWEKKKPGKGRPYRIYSLKIGFNEIISRIEKQQKKEVDDANLKIERLKGMT